MTTETIQNEMTIFANQIEMFETATQEKIKELNEDSYCVEDMINFIDENGENNFVEYYEQYVNLGENYHYDAVDEYISEFGIEYLNSFEDSYRGKYWAFVDFARELFDEIYLPQIPEQVHYYIDYDKFANDLEYDYMITDSGFVFDRN